MSDDIDLLRKANQGDSVSLEQLFGKYSDRLKRMVRFRMHPRLQARVSSSDILQDAYIEICEKLDTYVRDPKMPFFLWLRLLTGQKLALAHRQHLDVQARDAGREISLFHGALPEANSAALAAQLMGRLTSPSGAAMKAEMKLQLQEALNAMAPLDREVLSLRHFEQLSNSETATVLDISESAACNRYVRALERLKKTLGSLPGGKELCESGTFFSRPVG